MRMRPIILAALLVGGFVYVTSGARWNVRQLLHPITQTGKLWSEPGSAQTAGFSTDELSNIDIYKAARQATVNITSVVYQENWFFQLMPSKGTGSGFIIDTDGRILTNNHVVSGSSQLSVTLADKKTYKARILGTDARNDLALIKIEPRGKMPFLKLGDSDPLQVGQKVLAIGNPFGLQGTLTTGIVSSLGRDLNSEEGRTLFGMVQTDAAINPGNSGGPLLDSRGNVIGINTAIYGPQGNIGIGFAMPINRAKAMLEEFQSRGRISRPTLGIQSIPISGDLAVELQLPESGGLLVQRVERGTAAEEAGLRGPQRLVVVGNYRLGIGGDLITAVDGQAVEGNDTLQRVMTRKRAGDNIELTIVRGGRTQKVLVKLGEVPQAL